MSGYWEVQYVEGRERKSHPLEIPEETSVQKAIEDFLAGRTLVSATYRPTGPAAQPRRELVDAS